jgi:Rne/Rng family ribonuclease
VKRLVLDSPRTYHEVTSYLQEVAPELCSRVDLYEKRKPIFDEYNIEKEIDNILCKRVPLHNGGSLVIEQTEALVSIDVNGGHSMFGQGTSQEKAILEVNLEAAKQVCDVSWNFPGCSSLLYLFPIYFSRTLVSYSA